MPAWFRPIPWLRGSLAAALLAAGCELTEVATPVGEDVVVVEGVLRAGEFRQNVLLHRSLNGDVVRGEPDADVRIRLPDGVEVRLAEASLGTCTENLLPRRTDSLTIEVSCYSATVAEGLRVLAGATYELLVQTADGRRLRGRTEVPGSFQMRLPSPLALRAGICRLPPATTLPLTWTRAAGAWTYLSLLEVTGLRQALRESGIEAPERLELTGLAVSEADTVVVLPTEFGVFERFDRDQDLLRAIQNGFPEGVRLQLVIAAADRNYVNAVRGGGFNPSGNVRISSVVGDGVGVFASLVPREFSIEVSRTARLPACL